MHEEKIVDFEQFCPFCKHYSKSETEDPCWECLDQSTNVYSNRPVNFEEGKRRRK